MLAPNKTFPEDAGGRVPMGAPVVEILSADKVFPNGTRALAPIDLTIAAGEFLTLIGPSGCGKSTLLKLIANLSPPTAVSCGGPAHSSGSDRADDHLLSCSRTRP